MNESLADLLADVSLAEVTAEQEQARDIDAALQRLLTRTFGSCIDCGEPIGRDRLEVYPTAKPTHPLIERTAVDGIAFVRTALDGRVVVQGCRALFKGGFACEGAIKWTPVDDWCRADLQAIRRLLAEHVRDRI